MAMLICCHCCRDSITKDMLKSRAWVLFLLLSSLLTASAQESQTEYNFLRLPVSAHAAALGGEIGRAHV